METFWFAALAWMAVVYVILDGYDWGAGILHLWVAKNDDERRQVLDSIGPLWDGNEVWLIALGGTMFSAFPHLLATALSGLYLPITIVVWLLIGRAISIELRHQIHDRLWTQFWDAIFFLSSLLLAIFFGAALGNLIRGVSLDANGVFFAPLWTDFRVGETVGILDWYTVLVGAQAAAAITYHGSTWLFWQTAGAVQSRARGIGLRVHPWLLALTLINTAASFWLQPNAAANFQKFPWLLGAAALTFILGTLSSKKSLKAQRPKAAFIGSALYLAGLLACAALTNYPQMLPARHPEFSLTAQTLAAPEPTLRLALYWWLPGMALALGYSAFTHLRLSKKT